MLPTREEALKLICDGLLFNPGPWGKHCLTAAHCAEKIASACGDMDVEKAYILGLLHDIGRKFDQQQRGIPQRSSSVAVHFCHFCPGHTGF